MSLEFLKILVVAWATLWVGVGVVRLARGRFSSIYVVMIVFYVLFIVPLLLDVTMGLPEYRNQPGFLLSFEDPAVNPIYLGYMAFIAPLWVLGARQSKRTLAAPRLTFKVLLPLGAVLLGPLGLLLAYPEAMDYVTHYGHSLSIDVNPALSGLISGVTVLSVLAAIGFIILAKRTWYTTVGLMPMVTLSVWMNGKRAIIAIFLVMFLVTLLYKRAIRRFALVGMPVALMAGFMLFSSYYLGNIRSNYDEVYKSPTEIYTNNRIDFGRDDVTKMTIYAELNPDIMRILEYRGQSFLFNLMPWIPRAVWPNKPLPYAQYVTSAMLITPPQLRGWGMTTSLLEEAIANFSWWGMLIGPLMILGICNYGDRPRRNDASIFTVIVASLLLAVHAVAFYPIIAAYTLYVVHLNRRISREMRREREQKRWDALNDLTLERREFPRSSGMY
ncbi:hypothetical protein D3875_21835 [Deinococcus cavernae]|uniref:Oligosaccharide repeat unit polymerase n=1 Tax=Deinococcus cavernae TaxID=2320857 RepID=A0A418UZR7_9DEIO|nr:hypothetical protein [Deinococcus cavernae]RJF68973.1 hypothetical protein D3875_21835 [Deinococcus cavernae]